MNREIGRTLKEQGAGTKAHKAIKLAREEHKPEKHKISRQERIQIERELFIVKQLKKKEKKKGH